MERNWERPMFSSGFIKAAAFAAAAADDDIN